MYMLIVVSTENQRQKSKTINLLKIEIYLTASIYIHKGHDLTSRFIILKSNYNEMAAAPPSLVVATPSYQSLGKSKTDD